MRFRPISCFLLGALVCVVNLLAAPGPLKTLSGMALLVFVPGLAFVFAVLDRDESGFWQTTVVTVGASLGINTLVFLLLNLFLAPLEPHVQDAVGRTLPLEASIQESLRATTRLLIGSVGILSGALFLVGLWRRRGRARTRPEAMGMSLLAPALLALFAGYLRFASLGYSELQGDEAYNCATLALDLLRGDTDALFTARRPPVQALVPAMTYLLTRELNEFILRIPFAVVGTSVVLAIMVLGRELFGRMVGLLAGLITAVSGYAVAFSRIVQFQPILVLWSCLSLLFLWRLLSSDSGVRARRNLHLALGFLGLACLSHFEGFALLPLVLYGIARKRRLDPTCLPRREIGLAALPFLLMIAAFYLPFLLAPERIAGLSRHAGGRFGGLLHFNMSELWRGAQLYCSQAFLPTTLPLAAIAVLRKWSPAVRLIAIWFTTYFVITVMLMKDANTHIQFFFFPLSILAACGITALLESIAGMGAARPALARASRALLISAVAAAVLAMTYHVNSMFVEHEPERMWSMPPRQVKSLGLFGFPYRRGWKTVGYLFRSLELRGSYWSNEKGRISSWYLRQKPVPRKKARYLIYTDRPQSWRRGRVRDERSYQKILEVGSTYHPTLVVYQRVDGRLPEPDVHPVDSLDGSYYALDRASPEAIRRPLQARR